MGNTVWVVEASSTKRFYGLIRFEWVDWRPMLWTQKGWPSGVHFTRSSARDAAKKMTELNQYATPFGSHNWVGVCYRVRKYEDSGRG